MYIQIHLKLEAKVSMRIFQKPCWKTAKTNVSIGIFFHRPEAGNFPVIVGKWTSENIQRTQKSSAELSAAKAGVKADVWPTETLNQFVQKTGLLLIISNRNSVYLYLISDR